MPTYIRGENPVWSYVDLTGKQFDDTFYMFVLENTIPYIPAVIYNTENGTPIANPVQFYANGTLPIDIFFDPNKVYRLEFRQGNTQSDPLIYPVENYVPGFGGDTPIETSAISTTNQITNPQFALVNFSGTYTLVSATDPDPIEFAPGWFLNLVGTGNVTIDHVPLNNDLSNPTNASWAINIQINGTWTTSYISQRFFDNGMLWSGKYVSNSITALIEGSPQDLMGQLAYSDNSVYTILNAQNVDSTFNEYVDAPALIPDTTNADFPPDAYVEYQLLIPNSVDLFLTSIQLIASNEASAFTFEQDSINRQIDQTFHYYKDQIFYKPISSYLVGWDFPLNPTQVTGNGSGVLGAIGVNKGAYAWDQTIIYESVDDAVTYARNIDGSLLLTASKNTKMAIIQYLPATEAIKILQNYLSVNVRASSSDALNFNVSLWWTDNAALPDLTAGTNNTLVLGLDSNGHPSSVVAGWNEVSRGTIGDATNTFSTSLTNYPFFGWQPLTQMVIESTTPTFFAIVVGTSTVPSSSTISFNAVSLAPGLIATIPAPQTQDEVLRESKYYFQSTFASGIASPTATINNARYVVQDTSTALGALNLLPTPWNLNYDVPMRSIPRIIFYSGLSTTANKVYAFLAQGGSVVASGEIDFVTNYGVFSFSAVSTGGKSNSMITNKNRSSALSFVSPLSGNGFLLYHCTIDARLGLVT